MSPSAGCGGNCGAFTITSGGSFGSGGSLPVITRLATLSVSASGACCTDQLIPDFDAEATGIGDRSSAVAWYFGVWFFEYATALTVISTVTRRTIHFRRAITPK